MQKFIIHWDTPRTYAPHAFNYFKISIFNDGEGNGNPLQCSCLENPRDGGAWWAAVHGVAEVGHDWATSLHVSLLCIGEGNGNPFQCSCLENPRDGEAWWAAVYGVAQSQTRLKWLSLFLMKHKSHWVIFYVIQLKIINVGTQTYCMILFMGKTKKRKAHGIKNRLMVSRAQGRRKWEW